MILLRLGIFVVVLFHGFGSLGNVGLVVLLVLSSCECLPGGGGAWREGEGVPFCLVPNKISLVFP